jgi:hypothetical protein
VPPEKAKGPIFIDPNSRILVCRVSIPGIGWSKFVHGSISTYSKARIAYSISQLKSIKIVTTYQYLIYRLKY